jgi:hypothetical protein
MKFSLFSQTIYGYNFLNYMFIFKKAKDISMIATCSLFVGIALYYIFR